MRHKGGVIGDVTSDVVGWVFESQQRQTYVVIKSSDSSTAKRSATSVSVMLFVDDHYKHMSSVTVGVARLRTLTAQ